MITLILKLQDEVCEINPLLKIGFRLPWYLFERVKFYL